VNLQDVGGVGVGERRGRVRDGGGGVRDGPHRDRHGPVDRLRLLDGDGLFDDRHFGGRHVDLGQERRAQRTLEGHQSGVGGGEEGAKDHLGIVDRQPKANASFCTVGKNSIRGVILTNLNMTISGINLCRKIGAFIPTERP
jgi:hypothetical protein